MLLTLLLLPIAAGATPFDHVVVDEANPADPHCKAAGDFDGDGLCDLTAAGASDGGLWWYRAPNWSKHRVADGSFTTDMAVGDFDGDGRPDIIIPSRAGLMWYRNPGAGVTEPWPAVNLSPAGAAMHDVELADLDGDGRLDIVTRHQSGFGKQKGNAVHLWLQTEPGRVVHREFACPHGEGLEVADIDGDGRPDVVIGGRWYRNPGDPLTGEWTEHRYVSDERFERAWTNGDCVVRTGDIDGDGRLEIAVSPAEGRGILAWFAAPADPRDGPWTEHLLAESLDHVHALALGDVDGDGRLEVVYAKMHQATAPQEVVILRRSGDGWERQVLASTGSHNLVLVDLRGDGKLSVFGANWNNQASTHGRLELWVNQG